MSKKIKLGSQIDLPCVAIKVVTTKFSEEYLRIKGQNTGNCDLGDPRVDHQTITYNIVGSNKVFNVKNNL